MGNSIQGQKNNLLISRERTTSLEMQLYLFRLLQTRIQQVCQTNFLF